MPIIGGANTQERMPKRNDMLLSALCSRSKVCSDKQAGGLRESN
jgi:hypothetical protein